MDNIDLSSSVIPYPPRPYGGEGAQTVSHSAIDDEVEMSRDVVDELNARACPLLFPTTKEVGVLRDFMKMKLKGKFKGEQLYHYTNCDVAKKLFEADADLWCTHYRFMNDSMEWLSGLELISDILREEKYDEIADEVDLLPEKTGSSPWITSFSTIYDKASMWGMYCDRNTGGYAIGFNQLELDRLITKKNMSSRDEYFLLPCIYDIDFAKKVLQYILEFHSDEDEHLRREGAEHELMSMILSRIFFLSLIVKHPSFDYENEWRLIVRKHDAEPLDDERLQLIYSNGNKEKPHIASDLFEKPLREYFSQIVVSPCGNIDDNYMFVDKKRVAHNLNDLLIKQSSSPYNGR